MFKIFYIIGVVLILYSCTSTTVVPSVDKNTESHITIGRGNNIDETIMSSPIQKNSTATGNTATGKISTGNTISAGTGVIYSTGLQDIIKLQLKKGPEVIMEVDCDIFTGESKKYCDTQQQEINDRKNELNWEKVLKMGPEYIRTFDCKKILSPYGQGYCKEYQLNLK